MDDDDDIFGSVGGNQPTQPTQTSHSSNDGDLMGGLGGVNFGSSNPPPPQPKNDDPFNILGLSMGEPQQPQPIQQTNNYGMGEGDLLGFGEAPSKPPAQNTGVNLMGDDFMGMGNSSSSQPSPAPSQSMGGFNFGGSSQPNPPQQPQPPQDYGFNFGSNPPSQPAVQKNAPQSSGFVPIVNNNPNKILAYENNHIQIWIDCIKESNETTKLFTTYINKTNNTLTDLTIQAAVLKHVKLVINPLNSTTLQPYSKEVVHQVTIF